MSFLKALWKAELNAISIASGVQQLAEALRIAGEFEFAPLKFMEAFFVAGGDAHPPSLCKESIQEGSHLFLLRLPISVPAISVLPISVPAISVAQCQPFRCQPP